MAAYPRMLQGTKRASRWQPPCPYGKDHSAQPAEPRHGPEREKYARHGVKRVKGYRFRDWYFGNMPIEYTSSTEIRVIS